MWIQVLDGSYRQLTGYSKIDVFVNGVNWDVGNGTGADTIAQFGTEAEADAALAALMQIAGGLSSSAITALGSS
jgi:hypothetical protein